MSHTFLIFLAIFLPVLAAGMLTGWVGCLLWTHWRDWRRPAPYALTDTTDALASSVQCTWCRPAPRGLCSCTARCGHLRCVHVPGRGWSTRDRDILEGKKLP